MKSRRQPTSVRCGHTECNRWIATRLKEDGSPEQSHCNRTCAARARAEKRTSAKPAGKTRRCEQCETRRLKADQQRFCGRVCAGGARRRYIDRDAPASAPRCGHCSEKLAAGRIGFCSTMCRLDERDALPKGSRVQSKRQRMRKVALARIRLASPRVRPIYGSDPSVPYREQAPAGEQLELPDLPTRDEIIASTRQFGSLLRLPQPAVRKAGAASRKTHSREGSAR